MRTAWIVGGTGALGEATSRLFHARGWRLAIGARNAARLSALKTSLDSATEPDGASRGAASPRVSIAAFDASVSVETLAALTSWREDDGPPDACLHLGGGYAAGREASAWMEADWRGLWEQNFLGPALVLSTVSGYLRAEGRRGSLLAVAAAAGLDSPAGKLPYGTAKAALAHLVRGLADEGRSSGVRANALVPLLLDTPENRAAMPNAAPSLWVSCERAALILEWLASSESEPVTGSLLRL